MDYFSSDKLVSPAKGSLLISEPYMADPNFKRTVIFICEHDENGTFGFVLNKEAHMRLGEVLDEVKTFSAKLFIGGPVGQDTLHWLHRVPAMADGANKLSTGLYWGGSLEKLVEMAGARLIDVKDIRFFVGYSGWAPGQLMDEIKAKSWIVFKHPTNEMIFDWDNQALWEACLQSMGGKFRLISNYPKDPRMN